jgi:hypothetical protein
LSVLVLLFLKVFVDLTNAGNNCERGGFVCEGYTQRTAFPRTATPKQYPTPIQSKDSFPDHGGLQARYDRPATAGAQLRTFMLLRAFSLYHLSAVISLKATLLLSVDDCFKSFLSLCQGVRLTNHLPGLAPTLLQRLLRIPSQKGSEVDKRPSSLILMKMYLVEQCLVTGDSLCMLRVRRRVAIL